jgi:hypothetical protein
MSCETVTVGVCREGVVGEDVEEFSEAAELHYLQY